MRLPLSNSRVGCNPDPRLATNRVGALDTLSVNAICSRRLGVTVIDDATASNLRASSAGIIPSQLLSTQTHRAFSSAHNASAMSTPKPVSVPSWFLYSSGGYVGSTPNFNTLPDQSAAPARLEAVRNTRETAAIILFIFIPLQAADFLPAQQAKMRRLNTENVRPA
ncbi:hypothetical protein D3C86_1328190 [compost metagenome]